jgi:hypothetical protein
MTRHRLLIALAAWVLLGLVGLISTYAHADEGYTCADVQAALATVRAGSGVSEKRAVEILEAMAKGGGARPEQIARAKRCLAR